MLVASLPLQKKDVVRRGRKALYSSQADVILEDAGKTIEARVDIGAAL
jgi:hypothetical protein